MYAHNHVLGAIVPGTNRRRCLFCEATFPADGTYEVREFNGRLERYPGTLFARRDGHQIRRFLGLSRQDILLHNWHDDGVYVFRMTRRPAAREELGIPCSADGEACTYTAQRTAACR
ncbi:MAG: hypothetical protein P1P90_03790 [Patescibacteria group bacterium]|nr:hypothetical protein [Patescibacteria group bacterium]